MYLKSMGTGDNSLCGLEDVVKLLLQRSWLGEGPVGFLLMTENDVFEDCLGDAQKERYLFVHLRAFGGDGVSLALVLRFEPFTLPSPPSGSVFAKSPSNVFIVSPPAFLVVTCRLRVAVIR